MSSVVRKQLMYTYLVLFKLLKLNENMKTIRQIGMTLLAIAWGVSSTSCSNDDENNNSNNPSQNPIENFNQGNMNFTEEAGEQTFTFTANTSWNVSVAETSGGTTWCTVSPASGEAGEQVVTVKVNANETYDDRSVTITLKAGTETETFVVTQKQRNALLLTSDKYEVDQKGGTIKVEVKANIDYTATISEICKDWITETTDASRGLTTTTKSYQISANEDGEKREGTIIFSNGTLTETVHVYQAGGNIILLTENEYYADAAGEEITVELRSNCEYEVVMPSVDWIHEAASRAMSSHTLHYTIDPNETYDNREAIIIYKDKNNSTADTLTIIQAQKDAIILSKKEYIVGPEGETIEVKLSSNTEYSITILRPWISEVKNDETRAWMENKHYFKIAKTNTPAERTGTIIFANQKGIREDITITQKPPILELISEKEILVKGDNGTLEVVLNANIDFDIIPQVDWINQSKITQKEDYYTITFSIDENKDNNTRSGEVIFSNEDFPVKETLTITQQGKMMVVTVKTPGTLSQLMYNTYKVTTLKVNGLLNETDFNYLNDNSNLRFLDLSDASVVGSGTSNANEIREDMFYYSKLETVSLPKDITHIRKHAFYGCNNLKEITIANKVVEIEEQAIYYCRQLKKIKISDIAAWCNIDFGGTGNPIIGGSIDLYLNDQLITDLVIPDGVNIIKNYAFQDCDNLTTVTIPNSVTEIGIEAFASTPLTEVIMSNAITKIRKDAFLYSHITTVRISDIAAWCNIDFDNYGSNPLYYGGDLYLNNQLITDLIIPNTETSIKNDTFHGCTSLINVTIPNGITEIGDAAFEYCENLTKVTIGNSVTTINSSAFWGTALTQCYIYATTPPTITNTSFGHNSAYAESTLYVPKGCVQAYTDAGWGNYFYNIVEMDK